MLDFQAVKDKSITYNELIAGLTKEDLAALTNEMVDTMLGLIQDCDDAAVTFQPVDAMANDPYATAVEEVGIAWTLGHVIVACHSLLGRSRNCGCRTGAWRRVPRQVALRNTVGKHLHDSTVPRPPGRERMRLASLEIWPAEPHMDSTFQFSLEGSTYNATGRFVLGLRHDFDHVGQIAGIVQQATAERSLETA